MLRVEASTMVEAPRETVLEVYADYPSWPRLFPTVSRVRLLHGEGPKLVLEVDHVEGKVINEVVVRLPDQLDLWEEKRRYDALFRNRFERVPDGTRFTVHGEIHLKGWARLLQPFLGGYARRLMRRLQLQPVKAEAEERARGRGWPGLRPQASGGQGTGDHHPNGIVEQRCVNVGRIGQWIQLGARTATTRC